MGIVESRYATTKIWAIILAAVIALAALWANASWEELNEYALVSVAFLAFVAWLDWMNGAVATWERWRDRWRDRHYG
jgi:hypothetical protein